MPFLMPNKHWIHWWQYK